MRVEQDQSRKVITVTSERTIVIDAETYLEVWPRFEPEFDHIVGSSGVRS